MGEVRERMMDDDRSAPDTHRVAVSDDLEVSAYLEIAGAQAPLIASSQSESKPERPTTRDAIAIIDYGSQYSQLIARRVREAHVYCELLPYDVDEARVRALNPRGFILSGGPASVYAPDAPQLPRFILESGLPILGICYGMQLLAHHLGGQVSPADKREYGHAVIRVADPVPPLFSGLPSEFSVWMSHADSISRMPEGFRPLASTDNAPFAAMARDGLIGIQFHPEVVHTSFGREVLANFLFKVAGCEGSWTPESYVEQTVRGIRDRVGDGQVICALSGGVDSAVAATLVHRAVGDQLTCIFVDNGLLRRQEPERVLETFGRHLRMNVVHVDGAARFLGRLAGVTDPEQKRRIVGDEFIRVFAEEAERLGRI